MSHSVDLDLLDSVIGRMKGFEGFFDEQIAAFDSAIGKLQGVWEGEAATAQQQSHQRLMAAAKDIRDGIADMRAAAQAAHGNYSAAIAANLEMWRS
ncbi:WXG100 family type VII secretion target [Nocardia lijiangensis]|uniref:WXG100 family type VII secretion target n=1 Tax=Nocardia lijiangensis TaxID=299618 RepID=UPI00082A7CFE|nr:WXG100 family type VII secretion target [Nocardia lijiangensis]